ncbi:MAG: hypothetical protein CME65_09280 [Halobacteriovoraceae bacterium]|nr:hypothetical protein [Halobacteriovoraceae bacterium]|tara:strand:- start:18724 stop:19242 length:519 start_codon:yes stop_codon:yes gene_type:complete
MDEFIQNSNQLEEDQEKEEYKKAYNYCIFLLSKRDYSEFKISNKLKSRKHSSKIIQDVVDQLTEQGYLREDEYKKQRIKQFILKGCSNRYIIQKLGVEHLDCEEEDIENIREEQFLSTDDMIDKLIEKKLRGKDIPEGFEEKQKLKNKVLRFLISKGHSFDHALPKLDTYFR